MRKKCNIMLNIRRPRKGEMNLELSVLESIAHSWSRRKWTQALFQRFFFRGLSELLHCNPGTPDRYYSGRLGVGKCHPTKIHGKSREEICYLERSARKCQSDWQRNRVLVLQIRRDAAYVC